MPFQTARIELSDEYKALTQRERDLSALAAETDPEKKVSHDEMAAMWLALALDYETESHNIAAQRCHRRAERLTWKI